MGNHNALGLSGGAGGVDHICKIVCLCKIYLLRILVLGYCDFYSIFGKNNACFRIFEHICYTLLGIVRVYRKISRSCLVYAENSRKKQLRASHFYCNKRIRLYSVVEQVCGNAVGYSVELTVGEAALAVGNGISFRCFLRLRSEQIDPCPALGVVERFAF